MTALSPFGQLPLFAPPYNSRVTNQLNATGANVKNYYMIAFTPGYALQASELNEIQELFYLHESLTNRMYSLWTDAGYSKLPYWEGLIPLNPTYVNLLAAPTLTTINGEQAASIALSVSSGWYLWTDSASKLGFWISNNFNNNTALSPLIVRNNEYIGFEVLKETINCCPSSPCPSGSDETLRDNSQGSSENWFTCGASRLSAKILSDSTGNSNFSGELSVRNAIASNFYPILKVSINNDVISVNFNDGQQLRSQ